MASPDILVNLAEEPTPSLHPDTVLLPAKIVAAVGVAKLIYLSVYEVKSVK